jgi:hypothetical protein
LVTLERPASPKMRTPKGSRILESLRSSCLTDGQMTGRVTVLDRFVSGGPYDGEPLFLERGIRKSVELPSP